MRKSSRELYANIKKDKEDLRRQKADLVEQRYHAFNTAIPDHVRTSQKTETLHHVRSHEENYLEKADDFSKQIQQFTNNMKVMRKQHRHEVSVILSNEIDVACKNNDFASAWDL